MDEAHDYFTSDEDRLADATRYAVKKGARVRGSESGVNEYGLLNNISKGNVKMFTVTRAGGLEHLAKGQCVLIRASHTTPYTSTSLS